MMAVIVGSLCFSVGEGLRLTPFPLPAVTETEYAHLTLTNTSERTSLLPYGPLDVPAQTQKRSKRQVVDLVGPILSGTRYVLPELSSLSEYESTGVTSVVFVPHAPGRAPPFLS